jgi:hypothetical protein
MPALIGQIADGLVTFLNASTIPAELEAGGDLAVYSDHGSYVVFSGPISDITGDGTCFLVFGQQIKQVTRATMDFDTQKTSLYVASAFSPALANNSVVSLKRRVFVDVVKLYDPTCKLAELAVGRIVIVPKDRKDEFLTRGASQRDIRLDVAVQRKLPADASASNDAVVIEQMMEICDQIITMCEGVILSSSLAAQVATECPAIFSPADLQGMRVATGIVTFTFRSVG